MQDIRDDGGQLAPHPWDGDACALIVQDTNSPEVLRVDGATKTITIPPGDTPFTMSRDADGNVIFAHPGGHVAFRQADEQAKRLNQPIDPATERTVVSFVCNGEEE